MDSTKGADMIVVTFTGDKDNNITRVASWQFLPKEKAAEVTNIPGERMKFDTDEIPTGFYQYATEFFLDGTKLRRFYKKDI